MHHGQSTDGQYHAFWNVHFHGKSAGGSGNSGGIVSATGAQDINVLLAHCSAPLAVSKLDSIKQFGPEENQFFDGTAIQARYLYDLFMPTKSVVSLGAIVEPAQAAGGN